MLTKDWPLVYKSLRIRIRIRIKWQMLYTTLGVKTHRDLSPESFLLSLE